MALAGLIAAALALGQGVAALPPPKFDADAAYALLKEQVAFGPRVPGTKAHLACRDRILAETKRFCDDARLDPLTHAWSRGGEVPMWNILGTQNWKAAKTRVVLLAHWDSRPSAEEDSDPAKRGKPIPGANDGASGVAVLLELMKRTRTAAPNDLGILYLFTDGEDLGPGLDEMFLGAVAYSKRIGPPRPDYGILLDMIGDRDLRVPMEPNSYKRAKGPTVALYEHARKVGLGATFPMRLGPEILDDHLSLNDAGVPTVDLIDFEYPWWHTSADTPDKCSAASLGKVGTLLLSFLSQPRPYSPRPVGR